MPYRALKRVAELVSEGTVMVGNIILRVIKLIIHCSSMKSEMMITFK
jgi:hypothetical protein